jgi:hypothetical protein
MAVVNVNECGEELSLIQVIAFFYGGPIEISFTDQLFSSLPGVTKCG